MTLATIPDTPVRYDRYQYGGFSLDQWRAAGRLQLDIQRQMVIPNMAYYNGEPPLTFIPGEGRDVFRRLLQEARTNWCELVVNAVAERLLVVGFNFGDDAIDTEAWRIWQDNAMDSDSEMAQGDALVCGNAYIGAWPDPVSRQTGVRIDIEHAMQMTLFYLPGTRRNPVAAFKSFGVEDAADPRYSESGPLSNTRVDVLITNDRVQTWDGTGQKAEVNYTGQVPYVEIVPAPTTLGPPRSELHSARRIQDRIHTTIYNRLVATDFGAFRQITATGIKFPRDAEGNVSGAPFNVGADRLLGTENPDGRFGVIPESNLRGYLDAVAADVEHLAAITQTPPHYLLGRIANVSGDALKAAETGLVSKVRRRAAHIGEAWEAVMRLALGYVGSSGADNVQAEVIWRDFETRSEGELVDALTKMATLRVPDDYLWQRWGVSPQLITQWNARPPVPVALPAAPPTTPIP